MAPRDAERAGYARAPTTRVADSAAAAEAAAMQRDGSAVREPQRYCRALWRSALHVYVLDPTFDSAVLESLRCDMPNEHPERLSRTFSLLFGGIQGYDWREGARRIAAPALVVIAENDQAAPPAGSREWATAIPDARVLELRRTGHAMFIERRHEVFEALRTFLAGRWPNEAS
jgi:pimeloyl-ACP methyl ester carboxylesterase